MHVVMDHDQDQSLSTTNPNSLKSRFAKGFLRALMRIQKNGSNSDSPREIARRRRRVKVAADAAMATAVGPRRVWSRAVLRRIRWQKWRRFLSNHHVKVYQHDGFVVGQQEKKLRDLVPGGEDMDIDKLLDETLHYIRCLTTQVNVMKRIADICSTTT